MTQHLRVASQLWLTGLAIAVTMSGCVAGISANTTGPATTSPTSATDEPMDSTGVETVRMSVQIGPVPKVWVVDLKAARAYTITSDMAPGSPETTSAPRPLSAAQIAAFRATLDAVGVWTWADWANANRAYAPAGNATVTLAAAGQIVTIDLGAPNVHGTDGTSHVLPGWVDFYNAVTALAGE